jgi:hypothetical protein
MIDYNNGKIYKIEAMNGDEGDIYIGSTTKKLLSERMSGHKYLYKKWKLNETNKTMSFDLFDKYGFDNCKIILIENVNANSKDELLARESYHIINLDCINKVIPNRTRKKYQEDNDEKLKDYYKNYFKENQEKIKTYRKDNRDKIFDYMKKYLIEYKEINKSKLTIQRSQKILCNCCNIEINITNKSRHNKSKTHLEKISK